MALESVTNMYQNMAVFYQIRSADGRAAIQSHQVPAMQSLRTLDFNEELYCSYSSFNNFKKLDHIEYVY